MLKCIIDIAREKIPTGQLSVIRKMPAYGDLNVTKFVTVMCEAENLSASAMWERLNSLKRMGLVDFGSKGNKGKGIRLTPVGYNLWRLLWT